MLLEEKLSILANSAKYDVSCSSSGSQRAAVKGSLGNAQLPGICHSWSADGRCISLFKILLSNDCIYDCAYCVNRASGDVPRATLTTDELVDTTIAFYRRNYIEGLFISSAVVESPDYTMERMIDVVETLRDRERYNGYIHLKIIPGASARLIERAGRLVDRVSVNTELPSASSLALMAPQKSLSAILKPMNYVKNRILEQRELSSRLHFVPAGQTTQVIIGATPDTDFDILSASAHMYDDKQMKRVYYSAFIPLDQHEVLPVGTHRLATTREHRLYQADWLMRFYQFEVEEIVDAEHRQLDLMLDPKAGWALRHLDQFPIDIMTAPLNRLLRIPGIGPLSAKRIVQSRRVGTISCDHLKKMGVVFKRAKYFLTVGGRYYGEISDDHPAIRRQLLAHSGQNPLQLSLSDWTSDTNG